MNHLKSQKHKDSKKRLDNKEASERDIVKELPVDNEKTHMVGETIAGNMQVFRVKVLSTFLCAGVPLNKLELFRELFEENGYRLTDRCNMYDIIPFIRKREFNIISEEMKGKDLSLIFDGTTWLGEALAIVILLWMMNGKLIKG